MNDLITATLVYDGGDTVHIPRQIGTPRADQMQGTPAEQLCELAGRVCYDSLGKGRPSFSTGDVEGYHDHIAKVGHGSVWEHFNFTIELSGSFDHLKHVPDFFPSLLNRPGVFVGIFGQAVRLTLNLRSAIEWDKFGYNLFELGDLVRGDASACAPHIVKGDVGLASIIDDPIDDNERWVSLFISGSRGLSHELVRHGDFTAISQRSTRFVDESDSPWVEHPLIAEWAAAKGDLDETFLDLNPTKPVAEEQYKYCVATLEPWLVSRGVDKTSARKQARGAARGYLGNALYTELIFSASVAQWKRILRQRASVFADAEIREMACKALGVLMTSRYGRCFSNWELQPSPDGIGRVAIEREAV